MKKTKLEKIIYKNYLKTSLTSILFIELVLIIIYFSVNNNMVNTSVDFILKEIEKTTNDLVDGETKSIERRFDEIEVLSYVLQNEHKNFFENPQDYKFKTPAKFEFAPNGMYYKTNDNGGSSVVISKNTKITPNIHNKLMNTEVFDTTFKSIVENHDDVVAVYFNSFDDLNRYYPFIPEVYNAFAPDIKMENHNFYYKADLKHNPLKKQVWTDVYLDPAGQGWMLSSIVPIYSGDFLEGVTGIDVTIDTFISNFLNINLPYYGKSFILNEQGKIVAMPSQIEEILEIKEVSDYDYSNSDKIKTTIYKASKFNILKYKDKNAVSIFQKIVNDEIHSNKITLNGEEYLIFSNKIEKTSWKIVSLIPIKNVLSNVIELEDDYKKIGYLVIAAIVFFYFLFFIYLYFKAKDLVILINTPIQKVINVTKYLGKTDKVENLEENCIIEIDELNKNFNELSRQLHKRTEKLIDSESKRIITEQLANTDSLTGAYNRRFLNDFASRYLKILKRDNGTLSTIVCDLDDFKSINDTYGHDVGDKIIKKFVTTVKSIVRDNDLIVRYGGDEFVVVLPNTDIKNAKNVATKISSAIEAHNKLNINKDLFFTVSMGISEYNEKDESIEDIIIRADSSLYEAKKRGKNCIV